MTENYCIPNESLTTTDIRGLIVMDEKLLEMLVCPLTHDKLRVEGDMLVNVKWGIEYPVRNEIPVMLLEEAVWPEGVNGLEEMKKKIQENKNAI